MPIMESSKDQYGFDAPFMLEVPDYLKCVACHLVLRKPVQLMKCGHRFCEPCFNRVKSYSENMNTPMICPVDRDEIDLHKVFEDNGINRVIGSLKVKCDNSAAGCAWTGDLRSFEAHNEQCKYRVIQESIDQRPIPDPPPIPEVGGSLPLLKELCQRMAKCEASLVQKENDIAFLKFNLQEVNKKLNERLLEVDLLRNENKNMEEELKEMNDRNFELKQVDVKMENMILKNAILEQKVDALENQLWLSRKLHEESIIEGAIENDEGEAVTVMVHKSNESEVKQQTDFAKVKSDNKKAKKSPGWGSNEPFERLVLSMNNDVIKLKDSLDKQSDEMGVLDTRVTTLENNGLGATVDPTFVKESQEKMETLKKHVINIENILFLDQSGKSEDIVLQWKLQNYLYHFDIGEPVLSPVFFTEMHGYSFKLSIRWNGRNKENLSLGLVLGRGTDCEKDLPPFNITYVLEAVDQQGKPFSRRAVTSEIIEANRADCFTILPGERSTKLTYGFTKFLTRQAILNYLVNDTLSIRCRLAQPTYH